MQLAMEATRMRYRKETVEQTTLVKVATGPLDTFSVGLQETNDLARAMVYAEIMGKPLALREANPLTV